MKTFLLAAAALTVLAATPAAARTRHTHATHTVTVHHTVKKKTHAVSRARHKKHSRRHATARHHGAPEAPRHHHHRHAAAAAVHHTRHSIAHAYARPARTTTHHGPYPVGDAASMPMPLAMPPPRVRSNASPGGLGAVGNLIPGTENSTPPHQ